MSHTPLVFFCAQCYLSYTTYIPVIFDFDPLLPAFSDLSRGHGRHRHGALIAGRLGAGLTHLDHSRVSSKDPSHNTSFDFCPDTFLF